MRNAVGTLPNVMKYECGFERSYPGILFMRWAIRHRVLSVRWRCCSTRDVLLSSFDDCLFLKLFRVLLNVARSFNDAINSFLLSLLVGYEGTMREAFTPAGTSYGGFASPSLLLRRLLSDEVIFHHKVDCIRR